MMSTHIVGDIGGTNARFATVNEDQHGFSDVVVFRCTDYPDLDAAISAYRAGLSVPPVTDICLAVAGPVDDDQVNLANNHWQFSQAQVSTSQRVNLKLVNDFTAQALCIDRLQADELHWLGAPRPEVPGVRAIIGPGTGLGVAIMSASGEVLPSEGGHMGFAPVDAADVALLLVLQERFGRVCIERILSGPGLENLYWAHQRLVSSSPVLERSAAEIVNQAREGDLISRRVVADFWRILGYVAGDIALLSWCRGGLYLSGGVLDKVDDFFDAVAFRAAFEDKGRFQKHCEAMPIAIIKTPYPGLLGCAAAIDHKS
jgi:glucokinase